MLCLTPPATLPSPRYIEVLIASTSGCELGNRFFAVNIKLKMKSLEWALIQYDCCFYENEKIGQEISKDERLCEDTQEDHVIRVMYL